MKGLMMNYPLTTNVMLDFGNRVFPNKEIVSYLPSGERHVYKFHDLHKRSRRIAKALVKRLRVKKGDIIGTFAWNHYQHVELYYGIPGAGAVCHTINIRLPLPQVEFIINNSEDRIIFADASLVPLLEKIAPLLATVEHFVILNAPPGFTTSLPNTIDYEELIDGITDDFAWISIDENEACGLCYTSGTTGYPKGALYSHRSTFLHAMGIMSPNAANISNGDRVLLIVPQFHAMAWGFPYLCVMAGAEMVLPSNNLQPAPLFRILSEEKVNKANGVPAIWLGVYDYLKKNPPKEKLPLKEILVGGSALPASLIENFEKDFGIAAIHAWGMTETSPLGTCCRVPEKVKKNADARSFKIRSKQGVEVPGIEIRAVNEDGMVVPRDGVSVGEFQVRGAWVIDGYFKVHNRDNFSNDGWFKTGDVGTIDPDGYMDITDRSKDLIKSGGEWISSVALEAALMAHPKVKEASVIAVPDPKWTERPLAIVVLREESEAVSPDELREALSVDFAPYQIPDVFIFTREIPKTSAGKFDKKEMRRMYAEGSLT